MIRQRFRNISQVVNLTQIIIALMSFLMGLIADVAGNFFSGVPIWRTLSLLTAPFIALGLLLLLLAPRREIKAQIQTRTLRTDEEKQRYANRGLIVFVSLYRPMKGKPPAGETETHWLTAGRALDYQKLDLENSNLATAINAVLSHAPELEHCWLIGTTSTDADQPGSLDYEAVLIEFLKKEKGMTCEFHSGPAYAIPLDDDALVCPKTYELVRSIYREAASRYQLESRDIIADFTGGQRSLTLGLILACLSVDQNVQLMGTRYDGAGRPIGQPIPIIFSFEPVLLAKL